MNEELHKKYKDLSFPQDLTSMFADIIETDHVTQKVCVYIGKTLQRQKQEEHTITGVTVKDIVENVKVERRMRTQSGRNYTYSISNTNIHRKTAENIVDKLISMSLLHYKAVTPYKFIFLTKRGVQVLEELIKRQKNK